MVDRGVHVNEPTFLFFRALEVQAQKVLPKHLAKSQDAKEALIKAVMDDEDVGFTWDIVATTQMKGTMGANPQRQTSLITFAITILVSANRHATCTLLHAPT